MRGTILEAWYEPADDFEGIDGKKIHTPPTARVYKETKYGTFYGEARAAECDEDIANSWDGFHFAEIKCDIQAHKQKMKIMKERAQGISHALRVVLSGNSDLVDDPVINKMYRQETDAWKNYYKAKDDYEILRDSYKSLCQHIIAQRRKIRENQN